MRVRTAERNWFPKGHAQRARSANQGARIAGLGREEFKAILKICEALRDHTKDLIKANAKSWTSGYAEDAS